MNVTYTVTKRGQEISFESDRDDREVAAMLASGESGFGQKLAADFARGWTPKQRAWAHYLLQPAPETHSTGGMAKIIEMFDHAAEKLRRPRIYFDLDGFAIELSRCGPKSRTVGAVNVTDGRGYGVGTWYGRIDRDGTTTIEHPLVLDFLTDFATDPAAKAAEYGRKSGNCCFCARRLTDDRSTDVGYGPVCASKYGLSWGRRSAAAGDAVAAVEGGA